MMISWFILLILTIIIIYHHVIYSAVMVWYGQHLKRKAITVEPDSFPAIAILIPAYNEEAHINAKLANLLMLDYPAEKLFIFICCDGCSDATAKLCRQWERQFQRANIHFQLQISTSNKGKLARLNQLMTMAQPYAELVALSDVSALISIDALKQATHSFNDPKVGAITGNYLIYDGNTGEKQYWSWQNNMRFAESHLGSVIGGNGAFYIMRARLFQPLPHDTINDDFMLPMQVLKQGYNVIYNECINSIELDISSNEQTHQRRQRIGAGNLQQLIRCRFVFNLHQPGVKWLFASGKGLRTLMPFLFIMYLSITCYLAVHGSHLALWLTGLQVVGYGLAALPLLGVKNKLLDKLHYLIGSYLSSLIGMLRYIFGQFRHGWKKQPPLNTYQHSFTIILKRFFDILLSCIGLLVTLPLWPLIALLIRLDSKGDIFYRQVRVGQINDEHIMLFSMLKFRTMKPNAEAKSGAVWSQKNDPRITRIGCFLRDTRLDELPQFINVIKGDMSLIGPRPERPELCGNLQNALPFYLERTRGLRPGITGLAQVNQGYDSCIEDVKAKIAWDHAYAIALASPLQWLRMDCWILLKTAYIMVTRRGQ
ncbi:sugar transferase [Photobacterium angustum]|uniref:LPS biosynthesis sugar transferase SypR n=1 Tax=Photobacterium angustum TaxID=661 RepID=A0A2S7W0Z5_PHOAN|nr:sugar transferase [Photobacterium angustum]PQJ68021.1 LPS biosynthesis sugar transferase SypR [Photobacterium angustum]